MTTVAMNQEGYKLKKSSPAIETLKRIMQNPTALVGLILFVIIVLIAIFGPLFAPYGYKEMDLLNQYASPSAQHWFGCDALGRDIFSRMLYGARYSLGLGLCATFFALFIGMTLGAIAGFFGGFAEALIMRLIDVLQSLPAMLLAIVISAALGSGFFNTVVAMGVSAIPSSCRMLRAQILSIRKSEYIEAAQSINCSTPRIILRHTIPNAFSPLIVSTTMSVGMTIQTAAQLSFIGLGVQPPTPEWGAMLSDGRNYLRQYPHMAIFPGLAIAITTLSLNLFGDGLRDALDPKLKR